MRWMTENAKRGAVIVLQKCLQMSPSQHFLLIHDETTGDFPAFFEDAASACDVRCDTFRVSTADQAGSQAQAFTADLRTACDSADGILVATTDAPACANFRIRLTTDYRKEHNAIATMPGATSELLATTLDVDYYKIWQSCRDLTLPLIQGDVCRIDTVGPDGVTRTLTFKLGGVERPPMQSLGVIRRNAWGNIPAGETFVAPLEDSADGEIVIDGAIGSERVTGADAAVIRFDRGVMTDHRYLRTGQPVKYLTEVGEVARRRAEDAAPSAAAQGDWRTIAELGIGVNPNIKAVTGIQLIDEKMYGTLHIAVGHNLGYGGRTNCPSVHCDMTTLRPRLEIDGRRILEDGRHVYQVKDFYRSYRVPQLPGAKRWLNPAAFVSVNDERFRFDINEGFLVRRVTGSGRETLYPLFDRDGTDDTQRLIEAVGAFRRQTVKELRTQTSMTPTELANLLEILKAHKVVTL